jgi:hypothetical protein
MNEFEQQLNECLEALTAGRLSLDECLRTYPEHADELRAHLVAASAFANASQAQPREAWAADARRRFLIASGQTLQQALDVEPEPSFFASARVRFLLAAQRLRQEGAKAPSRRLPVFGSPIRAFSAMAAGLVVFLGASSYTVASASAALPGDWNYGVKLQAERVRLALAVTEGQERDVKLDLAEERLREIERLASKGKIIGPGVLNRFADQTQPLVDAAQAGELGADDAARLQAVSLRSARVLDAVEPHVADNAGDQLAAAKDVSNAAISVTVGNPDRPPLVFEPGRRADTPTPEPTEQLPTTTSTPDEAASTPTVEPTVDNSAPDPDATPTEAPQIETATDSVVLGNTPLVDLGEIKLYSLVAGNLKVLIPGVGSSWFIDNIPASGVPLLITLKTQDQQSMVVLNTTTGDMYWYISPARNGRFDEVQMRLTRGGEVLTAEPDGIRLFYGADAQIPLLIMQSIQLLPDPVATPEPTETLEQAAP